MYLKLENLLKYYHHALQGHYVTLYKLTNFSKPQFLIYKITIQRDAMSIKLDKIHEDIHACIMEYTDSHT